MRGFIVLTAVVLMTVSAVADENWPNWRGPDQTGVGPAGDYPLEWSPEKNVAWKVELPGPGSSTPAVWGDQIFLTYGADDRNLVVSYNRKGEQLWVQELGSLRPGKHRKASGANPSPVTDGQHVWVYYKSGDLACLTVEGKLVWQKNLQDEYGKDDLWWDLGTSPVLTANGVVVAVMQEENSYVVALDRLTGAELWQKARQFDAPRESNQSYTTPLVFETDGKQQVAIVGADHATLHDAATGEEIWRYSGLNPEGAQFFRSISSPVLAGDLLIAPYSRGKSLTAIKLGGKGDVTRTHTAWVGDFAADVPSPAFRDGKLFVLSDKGQLACLDAASGDTIWKIALPRDRADFSSSPLVVGDLVYCVRENGTAHVVKFTDTEAEVVATNKLTNADFTVATPVPMGDKLLIRSEAHLWALSK